MNQNVPTKALLNTVKTMPKALRTQARRHLTRGLLTLKGKQSWCRMTMHRKVVTDNEPLDQYCLVGALENTRPDGITVKSIEPAHIVLAAAIRKTLNGRLPIWDVAHVRSSIMEWNDTPSRTHAQVVKALRTAIRLVRT